MKKNLLFTFLLIFVGCNTDENLIKNIIGSQLEINSDKMLVSSISNLDISELNKLVKIIIYTPEVNCSICNLKFPEWRIKHREVNSGNNNVGMIFITETKNIKDVEINAEFTKVKGLLLFDTLKIFKDNNNISKNKYLNVFLLNKDNEIILVGSPLNNDKLWKLYKKTIMDLLLKYEIEEKGTSSIKIK